MAVHVKAAERGESMISRTLSMIPVYAATAFVLVLASNVSAADFDPAKFRAMKDQEKLDVILHELDARDASLRNIEYKVSEEHVNIAKAGGARRKMNGYEYEINRLNETLWAHERMIRPDGSVPSDMVESWNGKMSKVLTLPTAMAANQRGAIRSQEGNCFGFHRYDSLLGIRFKWIVKPVSIAQWMRDSIAERDEITVTDAVRDNKPVIKVLVHQGLQPLPQSRELWLDPAHDFMIVKFDQIYGNHVMDALLEVKEIERIGGVWMPKRAVGWNTTDRDREGTETTHILRECKFGTVKAADLDVNFPVGAEVADAVRGISYKILPDGKFELHALADPETRLIHIPPAETITDHIDDETARDYTVVPLQ